ncbi:MAG: hypothetical protein HOF74_00335 [Gammaproteobacteria bacterium]|jgi:hypothetical protein|nr:hypothetical protein [Gammaproteobacteria bacterium]MBT3858254.1 hypothetical protein [Gammaproteobacteria bacterium]MBT3988623.1 hypothetical protein [Gammaproteobacteria bacterium]MBT4256478.1 hypothetical protein [Gammaproteobacteria bacterium]MBT4580439.1 hypothetical protein [Gammaproteobacteria bacterium]
MNKIRARAQLQFPTVLLTLISIIQALALELLWSKIVESEFLWTLNAEALIGWGMLSVAFLAILQIWVMYSSMVMGFVWLPSMRDSIVPFIIGIQEFMLITLIDESFSSLWLYVLASAFATAHWISHSSMRRARQDPENAEFFGKMEPAKLRDFLPAIFIVGLFVFFGLLIDLSGSIIWIIITALLCANIVTVVQMYFSRRLWGSIMALE